ncbi:double C2-like domain-containing protein beta [Pollicipes pollicipes]|uniref:double C2-like domain-containing protein beta n=1 Tax=Pollicipes pollicipes TaxID=41117 RepID=UPI0018852F3D|nr:double C2-like domain-containing protein beta [Pollicipes pollicipes]
MDEDRYGHDVLGETLVMLDGLVDGRRQQYSRLLLPSPAAVLLDSEPAPFRGRLLLSLKYVTTRHTLVVGVMRCADLPALDAGGLADPFVKVHLTPGGGKHKTAVQRKTLNPEFNEEFSFCCRRTDLPRHTLDIRVYDKDIGRSNDYIGGLKLSIDSHGERLRHWFDALKYPDTRHDRWHLISAEHQSAAV